MTTLRRALPALYKGESILALAALVCAAMLLAGQPALASSHGGGGGGGHSGGGGGHAGGGGGHASAGGHMSSHMSGGGHPGSGTAHPVGPGTHFGPGHGFNGGFDGRGFRGDHHFHGDFDGFGRFGFGGFGLGFGLGLGFGYGWDYPWGWGPGYYGYWGSPYWYPGSYPGYYGDGYYGGGYGYNDGYDGYNSSSAPQSNRRQMGALDLDISPSDAQVYLNGEYIGLVRDFGGWRHGYLWLEKGTYDIVFYRPGYKTLARQVTIYPGLVITWDDKMPQGEAVRPEDLPSKTHERRDSRLQFERDRAEQIDRDQQMRQQGGRHYGNPPAPPDDQAPQYDQDNSGWRDNWHDRVNRDRGGDPGNAQPQRYVRPVPAPGPAVTATGETSPRDRYGRLHLRIEPDDASVYLDGRFVGTGGDLAGSGAGLILAPGHHHLAVVRPGRKAEERDFDAAMGKDVDLEVALAQAQ